VLSNDNQATLQLTSPSTGNYTMRLTVTDSQGAIDSSELVICNTSTSTSTSGTPCVRSLPAVIASPPSASGDDGGGGAMRWQWLFALIGIAYARLQNRPWRTI
jgi:hypothetical protein